MRAEHHRDYDSLCRAARARHLRILCALSEKECAARDDLPGGTRSLLMLAPDEPTFWPALQATAEWTDGAADPIDRWSARVIGAWAETIGAAPLYPFGGPPFQPFLSWALASGQVHSSPIGMLVHDGAGLYVSFRGALALPWAVEAPPPLPSPCEGCAAPCLTACPADAPGPASAYDVPACKTYLAQPEGQACLQGGCLVRRACPAGRGHGRLPSHSAYHMAQFLGP